MQKTLKYSALFILSSVFLAAAYGAPPRIVEKKIKTLWSVSPEKGYIDNAFAFDHQGEQLAYIHTDSASFLKIVVLNTTTKKEVATIDVNIKNKLPLALGFAASGHKLVFTYTDAKSQKKSASLIDIKKKKIIRSIRAMSELHFIVNNDSPVLIATKKTVKKNGAANFAISRYNLENLKRLKHKIVKVSADGKIKQAKIRLLYWEQGMSVVVGMKKGHYDKKRDMNLPDQAVGIDVFSGKELWQQAPKDLVQWNKALSYRNSHSLQDRFVHVDENLKPLYLVDRQNQLNPLKTPVDFTLYEPRSLKQCEKGSTLYFSLTIDPVNAIAVARKQTDAPRADIYQLSANGTLKALGQIFTQKRDFIWAVGKNSFAYLRKFKGFGRGGKSLELYTFGAGM